MKTLITVILAVLVSGCATTYTIERTDESGVSTSLTVKSYREFPGGIDVKYNREDGSFELVAGEVSTDRQFAEVLAALSPLIPTGVPAE